MRRAFCPTAKPASCAVGRVLSEPESGVGPTAAAGSPADVRSDPVPPERGRRGSFRALHERPEGIDAPDGRQRLAVPRNRPDRAVSAFRDIRATHAARPLRPIAERPRRNALERFHRDRDATALRGFGKFPTGPRDRPDGSGGAADRRTSRSRSAPIVPAVVRPTLPGRVGNLPAALRNPAGRAGPPRPAGRTRPVCNRGPGDGGGLPAAGTRRPIRSLCREDLEHVRHDSRHRTQARIPPMTPELVALALAGLLQCVQFVLVSAAVNRELGARVTLSPRDGVDLRTRVSPRTGRLIRALDNHFEGLILFTLAVVVVTLSGRAGALTAACAWAYLAARVLYVPAYAFGWVPWRSVIWSVGWLATLAMLLAALF